MTKESRDWLQLFRFYQSGNLATAGGALDQPALYMHVMDFIFNTVNADHGDS